MTITRILPVAVALAIATAGPAVGQVRMPAYSPPGRTVVPSVMPTDEQPEAPAPRPGAAKSLERLTLPPPPGGDAAAAAAPTGAPPGSYGSPWYTDGPGCAGPLGLHGPVVYEVYTRTGPSMPFGGGAFVDRLNLGWGVAGGGRSMFFNTAGDAAWAVDLGLSYTYNRGQSDDFVDVFLRQQPTTNQQTGQTVARPDLFATTRLRALHRTSFNFALGRDWFVWGNGVPGGGEGWNFRWGTDVGGRWGTAHVDLVPFDEGSTGYSRRQKVFHGMFVGFHTNVEMPLGGTILFFGTRFEWGYDWMDIMPPIKGDVQNVNIWLTSGLRF